MPVPGASPALVFMHFLGGSAETWKPVEERLERDHRCVRLDLPGFGAAATLDGRPVAEMADWIEAEIAGRVSGAWVLVGHSMSAKVALLIARRAADGERRLAGLSGLVLAAGSPPSPEPMPGGKREEMRGWFEGDAAQSRREADGFILANVSDRLPDTLHERAVADVLRMSRQAWRHWLEHGSREDLTGSIGTIDTPALLLAGADDAALGPDAQQALTLPHLTAARLEIVEGAAHLLPMEQPDRVASLIGAFVAGLGLAAAGQELETKHGTGHETVHEAGRITSRTRAALEARARPDDAGYRPRVLDEAALACLRTLVDRILPRPDGLRIDLAARLDAMLAEATGDGWRFAALPRDQDSYRKGLATLEEVSRARHGAAFVDVPDAEQDGMLDRMAAGSLGAKAPDFLSGAQMQLWFEEVRGDAARLFMAHPKVQARIGCVAVQTGGDAALTGFAPSEYVLPPLGVRA
jgi:pimeloyl-ACP methyl ester carboxylesterase